MKRIIEFRNPVMDFNDMDYVVKIIPEIEKSFEKRKCDFIYNCSDEIEISIEQIDSISDEYEITISSSYIVIKN